MAGELYSERTGQVRALSEGDFMQLVWQEIKSLRDAGFFGNDRNARSADRRSLGMPGDELGERGRLILLEEVLGGQRVQSV